ncbi:MAG: ImmA/IrrE family metallo-endopeptidase [Gammaproteobacteria bacterium]|nr:ImmA/IrrE family metallo-endopeptidase [Gammaproteobacteria bacterium]MYE80755.1 ImmA/IrrE family metallo-endopeptidase [Gammaproteobacteria bacterium]
MVNDARIQSAARELHEEVWKHRHEFYPLGCNSVDLLHPRNAAVVLGYDYEEVPEIADWPPNRRMLIAGMVDPLRRRVVVSESFEPAVMRFTGAHEIGHIVLDPPVRLLRERPMDGPSEGRTGIERAADKFAALYLLPERLVWTELREGLGVGSPVTVDENFAFWLDPNDHFGLLDAPLRAKSRALAACTRDVEGRHVVPLHERLGVSAAALAIRLEEIGVIRG